MTATITVAGLTRRYHNELAVDGVSFEVDGPSITGLLGRNGAGKTTLLRLLAGQELASSGKIRVFGANPVENDDVLSRMVLVREDQAFPDMKVAQVLRAASWCYPAWSTELADTLLHDFNLPLDRRVKALSRGMRSALGIVLGLAARAEVTLFDEPYAGLDAGARRLFYDRLLADYAEHPRTVLLSTHLIDEAAGLLERVLVIEAGRIVLDASTEELHGAVTAVSGPAPAVERFVAGRRVTDHRQLASQASAIVAGALDDVDRARARTLQLRLEPLSLQEVVIHTAARPAPATPAPKPQERSTP
jgi:ABC-2 type transport system ATP-binding protein